MEPKLQRRIQRYGWDKAAYFYERYWQKQLERALKEMKRALKPGGRAVAAVWGRRAHCGWADIFPIVDARVKSEVCPLFFQLGTGDLLQQTFLAAGFEKETVVMR